MTTVPHGSWPSPISAADLASGGVRLGEPRYDGADLYWTQGRPAEAGRVALLRERGGVVTEVAPGLSVRTRVHEYGGGAWDARNGVVVISSDPSGQLLRLDADGSHALTLEGSRQRFADLRVWPELGIVLAVREDHSGPGEPVNSLVVLRLDGSNEGGGTVIAEGADFYACPELSRDGRLAWMEWRHPDMPWDACLIRTGRLAVSASGAVLDDVRTIAGGPGESAVHPLWRGPELLFCSDRSGFWELYASDGHTASPAPTAPPAPTSSRRTPGSPAEPQTTAPTDHLTQLTEAGADLVEPFWVFGRRPFALTGAGDVVLRPRIDGRSAPMLLTGHGYSALAPDVIDCDSLDAAGDTVVALVQFPDAPDAIIELSPDGVRTVDTAAPRSLDAAWVSVAEPVTWQGPAGEVHGWFYPPTNPSVEIAPDLPPLIVISHGGPTAFSTAGFSLAVQFWTTRGFAVLDVNYSGSSGYGRAYRDRLRAEWGVLDVADCVAGAHALAEQGRVDGHRLAIRGGSAGGYTTLRALTTSDVFAAGCSRYGIGDLAALASDTHKFEARYLDGLVGPWPEAADVYAERSPINHVDALNCPMLILQGAEDAVVPPNQAETMASAIAAKGLDVELIVFEGEGHGFRRAETIQAALEAELAFYARTFGITLPG
ncbi:alpha/beta hydrolase family protein [Micropruina sp.]|uniref:alpha/beta hydrolase family protein n=1 Tax=Micropruina sp. TaxID=2737536 RepID=UPI0039E3F29F